VGGLRPSATEMLAVRASATGIHFLLGVQNRIAMFCCLHFFMWSFFRRSVAHRSCGMQDFSWVSHISKKMELALPVEGKTQTK
jgi:hypothetical protein